MVSFPIYLSADNIRDGNYEDFYEGQLIEFPLELHFMSLMPCMRHEKSLHIDEHNQYAISGEISHYDGELLIVDFGMNGFTWKLPFYIQTDVFRGMWIQANVSAEVGWYYYDRLAKNINPHSSCMYTWQVTSIFIASNGALRERVTKTNALTDEGGSACYVLFCEVRSHVV